MNPQYLAWLGVQDALMSLGDSTMESIMWHMSRAGIDTVPETFNVRKFATALYDMIDGGADVLLDVAAKSMAARLNISVGEQQQARPLDRILRIMEVAQQVDTDARGRV
jgi:hypothetical protein